MSRKQRRKRARAKSATQQPASTPVPSRPAETESERPHGKGGSPNRLGLLVAVVGLAVLFGVVLFLGDAPPPKPESEAVGSQADEESSEPETSPIDEWRSASLREIPVSRERDFARGPDEAPVTIVEFSDFECPFCRKASLSLENVLGRFPEDVRLVYKNFPLDVACNGDMAQQLHPSACKAAIMARCAGRRDPELFWRFHDTIFLRDRFDDDALDEIAEEIGLADESFWSCVASRDVFDQVREDIELARSLGVHATPTLFVNGREAPSYEEDALAEIIDHIIATK